MLNVHVEVEFTSDTGDSPGNLDDANRSRHMVVDDVIIRSLCGVNNGKPGEAFDGVLEGDEGFSLRALPQTVIG